MPHIPEEELPLIQRHILRCVRNDPGRLPRSNLAKLLVGSDARSVRALKEHPCYGRLARNGRKDVTFHIDILLQQGYLALDGENRVIPAGEPD